MRVMLHCCCGPCTLVPGAMLLQRGLTVTGCFYNPNIHPLQEYLRRREGMVQVAAHLGMDMHWLDEEYHPARFLATLPVHEHCTEARCHHCYRLRLERVADVAVQTGHDAICSTLLYSKYQNHALIRQCGEEIAASRHLAFLYEDFRSGWQQGIDESKAMGVYRQPYCGCIYSEYDRYHKQLKKLCPA